MHIEVLPDARFVGVRAASQVCALVRERPEAWLGLPTGATPLPMYAALGELTSTGGCELGQATVCAIDEFCHPNSVQGTNTAYYRQHLRSPVRALDCPNPGTAEPRDEIHRLAEAIRGHGGLDLCVLGIGVNGHIAFNEPGSDKNSLARVVELSGATREAHAEAFGGVQAVPTRGMTLGVRDLLASRVIVVLASGTHKAAIVRDAIEGPATADLPASWLQGHPDVTWLLDKGAAEQLSPGRWT